MIKRIIALFLLLGAFVAHAEFIGETDIPLMDGMQVNENEGFSFDAPAGQITEVTAVSQKSVKEVRTFYQTTLKELGWQQKSVSHYERDQDELVLQVRPGKQGTIVKIQYSFSNK